MEFDPFEKQQEVLLDKSRIKCMFAGKRSGKSEAAYIEDIIKANTQPDYEFNGRDPYQVAVIAPTERMLRRLVWPKLRSFAAPFEKSFNKQDHVLEWNSNNSIMMGASGQDIRRIEGQKFNHVHLTEVFQMKEEVILEVLARTADSEGTITIEGSLGPNIPNPKAHWVYEWFVDRHFPDSRIWVWYTKDNPYFPEEELIRQRKALDPKTYRQMYEIDWDTPTSNAVYEDFDDGNVIQNYTYNPEFETWVSIDWGWAHPMACLFFQYDRKTDTVYLFDEIVESKLKIEDLFHRIKSKNYRITDWVCDIAGDQEREQTGISNVRWFKDPPRGISFKYRKTAVNYGITLVRSYIKNGIGQRKLLFVERGVPKTIDCIKSYHYPEKDGTIQNENPVKKDDDPADALRYLFVNKLDKISKEKKILTTDRWGKQWHF